MNKKLIKQMNEYYGCEYIVDASKKEEKPKEGKVYALTGGPNDKCIANGNTWAESEVKDCLLYTSPSPRDVEESRMPSSA